MWGYLSLSIKTIGVMKFPYNKQMTDKLENKEDLELKGQLEKIVWPIEYGVISIHLRAGKPTLIKVERTIKLD